MILGRPRGARASGLEATVLDLGHMGQASLTTVLDLRHMNVQITPQSEGRVSDFPTPATREASREPRETSPGGSRKCPDSRQSRNCRVHKRDCIENATFSGGRPNWDFQGPGLGLSLGRPRGARDRGLEATVLHLGHMGQTSLTTVLDLRHMNVQFTPQSEGRPRDFTERVARGETAMARKSETRKSRPCDFTTRVARPVAKVPRTPRGTKFTDAK